MGKPVAVDTSSILPEAPPPKPARRDAAIEAALRRFDGAEDAATAVSRPEAKRRAWARSPQFGLLVTASLIAAIGLPAAYISIRDGFVSSSEPVPVTSPPVAMEPNREEAVADAQPKTTPPDETAAVDFETENPQRRAESPAEPTPPTQLRKAVAAPPVVALAPPPPPAPAPAAPMAEREPEASSQQILVTGSRIARPNLSSADSLEVGAAEARNEAPDWVLEDRAYRAFLTQLQSAVGADDRNAVTKLIAFPLRVNSDGRSRSYRNATAVLADYDHIFTPGVRPAILDQRFNQLFGRDKGVMIGNGAVWFDHTCRNTQCSPPGPVRIKAVNN